jgi:hypothetical protein
MIAYALAAFGLAGWVVGVSGWMLARRWARDCRKCRIIIARKGRVVLDASLVEWLAWNKALPKREQSRGGIIFHANGIQVALARPKIGAPAASAKTRVVKDAPAKAAEVIGA